MNKKQRLKRAFTITELVIVIAVIAVLAAVLIPTFASVVKSANKSADETYLKNVSDTIANYTASNGGVAPKDYPEMMKAVSDNGLCDPSNPYLLATKLKEDNVRMVWFPNTTKVQLVDTSRETLLWQTGATRGMGNYALIGTTFEGGEEGLVGSGCYVLCVSGDKSCEAAAKLYYEFYVTCGGNVDNFKPDVSAIEDKGWASCIVAAVNNAKAGYHNDEKVEDDLLNDLATNSEAEIEVKDDKTALSALATLATIANDGATKDKLNGKHVKLEIDSTIKEKGIDASTVTLAAIGNSYRKESNIQGGTPASTVSVDYNGLKLKNVNVPSNYVSSGAEFQTADDSGHAKGGYAFTYGMFGSIIAAPGDTVTIENLTIEGVNMDFTGASETINGQKVETFADNAGVIAGYVQGNVVLKNITINGKKENGNSNGFIKGYDAIAGVVGRAYGAIKDGERQPSTLTLDTVKVSDLDITGERRASGFVGYYGNNMSVKIENSSLTNVKITAKRSDNNTKKNECWAMAFAHVGNTSSHVGTLTVSKVELNNVATGINFNGKQINAVEAAVLKAESYIYTDSSYSFSSKIEECSHLLLVADAKTELVVLSELTFKNGGTTKTYKGDASKKVSKGALNSVS